MIRDCRSFLARLEDWLDGRLSIDERRQAERHLVVCAECRELTTLPRTADAAPAGGEALTSAILARTSGSPCASARQRLVDYVDEALAPVDAGLMSSHLERCDACTALARTVSRLSLDLPRLAELQPDPGFVADVLARTCAVPARVRSWPERLLEGLRTLAARPRFALEGAYVGTALLALLVAFPSSPLFGATQRMIGFTSQNPVTALEQPADRFTDEIRAAWEGSGQRWVDSVRSTAVEAADRSTSTMEQIRGDLGTLLERLTSELEKPDEETPPDGETTTEGETP